MSTINIILILVTFNATLISALSAMAIWFWKGVPGRRWLFYSLCAITIWNLFAMLQRLSPDYSTFILFYKILYIGANTTTALLLIFSIEYVFQRYLSRYQIAVLMVIPVIGVFFAFTNEWHQLFWLEAIANPDVQGDYIFIHGPLYWLSLVYNYLCGTASVLVFLFSYLRKEGLYRRQVGIILLSSLLPFVTGLLFTINKHLFYNLDALPVAFSLLSLGIVGSIFSQKMLDLLPVAREILVENMNEGVIVIDRQERIADINPAARAIFDLSKPLGKSIQEVFVDYPGLLQVAQQDSYYLSEISLDSTGSRIYEIQLVPLTSSYDSPSGKLIVLRDISLRKQTLRNLEADNQHLGKQAITDSMTGLYNRRHTTQRLSWEIQRAERYQVPLTCGLIDIDDFKLVNDSAGYSCGDRVIVAISDLLRNEVRSEDFVARVEGEKFMLIFPQTELEGAIAVMERLRRHIEQLSVSCYGKKFTASAAVTARAAGDTASEILGRQEKMLFEAKSKGKNCIVHVEPGKSLYDAGTI